MEASEAGDRGPVAAADAAADAAAGAPQQQPPPPPSPSSSDDATAARIEQLMRTRDDTSRFVGLALLKAVLDGRADGLATDADAPMLRRLWEALPARFLDRLLRAGTSSSSASSPKPDAAHMRDLAVAVLHTFAVRLPDVAAEAQLVDRIPLLVAAVGGRETLEAASEISESSSTPSTPSTPSTTLALQTLATLVSHRAGAAVFNSRVDDLGPLVVLAPTQPLVLDILLRAWISGLWETTESAGDRPATSVAIIATIDAVLPALAAAFADTDGVTLLDFVARLLRNASALESTSTSTSTPSPSSSLLPHPDPAWLRPVVGFVRRLAASRPTAVARAAYTHAAAALLRAYPDAAAPLLFAPDGLTLASSEQPFAFLLISLLLVDVRATLPGLLALLNTPAYAATAARLASALDVVSAFVGYLMRSLDEVDDDETGPTTASPSVLPPDSLLRLRTAIAETLSVTAEHLRDRWDAAVAGALGLHPDARPGFGTNGSHGDAAGPPLAWDAAQADVVVSRDPLVMAALRALALWLREDDNADLRREAAGLADMLMDLYRGSSGNSGNDPAHLDFRRPVLVALEGITAADAADDLDQDPVSLLLAHDAWSVLTADLLAALQTSSSATSSAELQDAARGIEIVRVLLPVAENELPGTRADWMDLVTLVAAWPGPDAASAAPPADLLARSTLAEFHVAVLQLVTTLVANAHPVMCRRYTLSISAVFGLALQLRPSLTPANVGPASPDLLEALDDVLATLENSRP